MKYLLVVCLMLLNSPSAYSYDEQKDVFVVVSGISTGAGIAPALRGQGYEVIHIKSNLHKRLAGYNHKESDYIANLEETDDANQLLNDIKKSKNIKAIITGAEAGVDLSEKLNMVENTPFKNVPELSNTRRNKYYMHEALNQAKVPSIKQYLAHNINEFKQWKDKKHITFPVVLKPVESAGTDNVFICNNDLEVDHAFKKISSSLDIYQNPNKVVLCQEYIGGQEYMVNTVSFNGEHRIIEVLKINKQLVDNKPLYDTLELLHPKHEDFKIINRYLANVYKTLGINYGAGHAEVKVWNKNNTKQATLIEVAVRLGGAASPSAIQKVQEHSQLSVLVKSYLDPQFLKSLPKNGLKPKQDVSAVFFIANASGRINKNLDPTLFRNLKTFHSIHFSYKEGDTLPKTTDLMNCPGYIYLIGTKQDINHDIETIRQLEKNLYANLLS